MFNDVTLFIGNNEVILDKLIFYNDKEHKNHTYIIYILAEHTCYAYDIIVNHLIL